MGACGATKKLPVLCSVTRKLVGKLGRVEGSTSSASAWVHLQFRVCRQPAGACRSRQLGAMDVTIYAQQKSKHSKSSRVPNDSIAQGFEHSSILSSGLRCRRPFKVSSSVHSNLIVSSGSNRQKELDFREFFKPQGFSASFILYSSSNLITSSGSIRKTVWTLGFCCLRD